ncbi:MAG: hypothetical protein ACTTJF_07640 [Campylobacter sp.]|uniref:hypothetical protein n=1 Tax=Campylobacter sp. TaxID=205 RepID=UPI003FA10F33
MGLKKRANAHLKGAIGKFKSEFSEVERDYALGELCREILDENQSELRNLKNRGNGELPFELGGLVGEYLKGRCDARTVEPYFCMLLDALDWGAHHFPEGYLIERARYERLIGEARDITENTR